MAPRTHADLDLIRRDLTRHAIQLQRVAEDHDCALRLVARPMRDPEARSELVDMSRRLGSFLLGVRGLLLAHGLLDHGVAAQPLPAPTTAPSLRPRTA